MYQDFIELYHEIALNVLKFKNNRAELVDILIRAMPEAQKDRDFAVYKRQQRLGKLKLAQEYMANPEWINPFSFFMFFNSYLASGLGNASTRLKPQLDVNWRTWIDNLVLELSIDCSRVNVAQAKKQMPYPDNGEQHHPFANRAHYFAVNDGWLQNYYQITDKVTVDLLWRLANYATNRLPPDPNTTIPDEIQFIEDFNAVAPRLRSKPLLSSGLNWMNPGVWIRTPYTNYQKYHQVFNPMFTDPNLPLRRYSR